MSYKAMSNELRVMSNEVILGQLHFEKADNELGNHRSQGESVLPLLSRG